MDPAYLETERIIRQMEKRLNDEYDRALKDVQATIDDYTRRFEKKDETWRGWVQDGKKTQEEYEKWRYGQMAVGGRWEELKDQLATDMAHTNEIARGITLGYIPQIYAENFNFGTYEIESATGIDTSFTLYNRDTVARIVRDDPKLLPEPGKKVSQEIREGKAVRWNRQHIQSAMMQSILQGESIPKMATRLQNAVGDSNRAAAIRNARTMATGAQNAGRFDAYRRGEEYGVKTKKEWRATLDMRTRHSHRALDGEVVDLDEEFSNGLMYPGDMDGDPSEVYNCRCRMLSVVAGVESRATRSTEKLDGMTYEEWKNEKSSRSNPITLPEEKAKNIRNSYISEYRTGAKPATKPTSNTSQTSKKTEQTTAKKNSGSAQTTSKKPVDEMTRSELIKEARELYIKEGGGANLSESEAARRFDMLVDGNTDAQLRKYIKRRR